jgi:putative endonuclease
MKYTVYVLYSATYNKHYTGYSSNLAQRLESHNVLGKEWTSRYRPWKLIYNKEFDDQSAAMQYEAWLKTGVGRDFIKRLDH